MMSSTSTCDPDCQVHLGWGVFSTTLKLVYEVEINHRPSSSSQQLHKCHLEVTKACNVTFD